MDVVHDKINKSQKFLLVNPQPGADFGHPPGCFPEFSWKIVKRLIWV